MLVAISVARKFLIGRSPINWRCMPCQLDVDVNICFDASQVRVFFIMLSGGDKLRGQLTIFSFFRFMDDIRQYLDQKNLNLR